MSSIRIGALYIHPAQYAAPLFRELSRRPGVDFTAYFLCRQGAESTFDAGFGREISWDISVLEGYKYKFLPNLRAGNSAIGFFSLVNFSVIPEIRRARLDALLVHGYEHLSKWLAFGAAMSCGTRLVLRGESHLDADRKWAVRAAKDVVFRNLFRRFDGFAYIGTLNRQYYESYGVQPGQLHFAPYTVDNAFFEDAADRHRERRAEIRSEFGVQDDAPVVLFVGKLCERKQPEMLLRAFAEVRKKQACHLLFAGDGELREQIENLSREMAVPNVRVTGFLNQSEIPRAYACADVFVLPSAFETWGLVVNEAMACGLPVVTTESTGCAVDLVREGLNGFVVGRTALADLTDRIGRLVDSAELRSSFGKRSAETIKGWSMEKAADGILESAGTGNKPLGR